MKFLQASVLSGLSILSRIITGILAIKVVAIKTGPAGVALMGQFSSFFGVVSIIAGGGISLGVVKFVAEYCACSHKFKLFLQTAMSYTLFFTFLTALVGLIFAKPLSIWILGGPLHTSLMRYLFLTLLLTSLTPLIHAILNGTSHLKCLVMLNIQSHLVNLGCIFIMTFLFGLQGAFFAVLLSQILTCLISLKSVFHEPWFSFLRPSKPNKAFTLNLSRYAFMNIFSALSIPIAQILVRNDLSRLLSWQSVGYWQAVLRISDAYLVLVTTLFTSYFLPRFVQSTTSQNIKQEVIQAHVKLLPLVFMSLFLIYVCRNFIITLLYHSNFQSASPLFLFQLLGDFFRISGWIITYLLLAKEWTKTYIATEVALGLLFVLLSYVLIRYAGLIGVTYAFAATYFIYWLGMAVIAQFFFKYEKKRS